MSRLGGFLKTRWRYLAVAAAPLIALMAVITAYANDNTDAKHWHAEAAQYRLLTDELPDAWENPIRDAAEDWSDETDVTITESSSTQNLIWRGSIPIEWWGKCPPSYSAACTWIYYYDDHIYKSRMVFSWDYSFNTASWKCWLNIGRDVQTYALHEFGHFAGYLLHSNDSDAIMHYYLGDCQRDLDSHDIQSMNSQYGSSH